MNAIITRFFISIVLTLLMVKTAQSQEITSAYTKIDLEKCSLLDADNMGASWACPGYKGFPLYVAEGDLRFFVSFGFGALDEKAASQTLPAFNNIGKTLEWRLKQQGDNKRPFATILRWFPEHPKENGIDYEQGNILIVTKIETGNTCQIARIDTKTVKNANLLARSIADKEAESFNCQTDQLRNIPNK